MLTLEQDNLQEVIQQNNKVIVQYGASWCGMCRLIKPKFDSMENEHDGVTFVYVDAEKFPGSRELAEVQNLPTFAGFVGGKLVKSKMGSKEEAITEVLNEIASH